MSRVRALYHLVRADFYERVRRYAFLVMLGLTIAAGYTFVPAADAGYVTVDLGGYRGVYNSAWIGGMVALLVTTLVTLPGFFIVKNTIERDTNTGVGQIIATTPLSRPLYTFGKFLSNWLVLAAMVGALAATALAMQWVRGEVMRVDVWPLLSPFLLVALPAMALVAALAVLFEAVGWLRGGLGNIVYFLGWLVVLLISLGSLQVAALTGGAVNDSLGLGIIIPSMQAACVAAYPGSKITEVSIGVIAEQAPLQLFTWEGVTWTRGLILGRLLWLGVAAGLALVAALPFNRFDPARERRRRGAAVVPLPLSESAAPAAPPASICLTPLPAASLRYRIASGFLAELRLMLSGLPWWWFVVAAGLIVAQCFTPLAVARQVLLPIAWLWPVLAWSGLGCREARHATEEIVFSSARPLARQLPASWLAGATIAALAGSGVAVRLLLAGNGIGLAAWAVGVAFIPSLALAAGIWSGSSKLFEVVYCLLWYAGPMSRVSLLDYAGTTDTAIALGTPLYFVAAALGLIGLAVYGRQQQLRRN